VACDGTGGAPPQSKDAGRVARESGLDAERDAPPRDAGCVPTLDENPYCEPYPTSNLGTMARGGTGSAAPPGDVIQNFMFQGYANPHQGSPTVEAEAPVTIGLADFYDPHNRKYELLHLSVVASWCGPANLEAVALVGAAATLAEKGVVILQALDEGPTMGVGATLGDLKSWMKPDPGGVVDGFTVGPRGPVSFNMVLDPEVATLGVFFSVDVLPWAADIDVRTMEILDQGVGYDPNTVATIEGWLKWVETNPPSKE